MLHYASRPTYWLPGFGLISDELVEAPIISHKCKSCGLYIFKLWRENFKGDEWHLSSYDCSAWHWWLDNKLSVTHNISSNTKSCFFHQRRIRQIKSCLNELCLQTLVQALVISRLEYGYSVLVNLPDSTLHPYTTILHSSARLAKGLNFIEA